jgi:hypothetical protein
MTRREIAMGRLVKAAHELYVHDEWVNYFSYRRDPVSVANLRAAMKRRSVAKLKVLRWSMYLAPRGKM